MRTIEYRVVISTDDERPDAPERLEATLERALGLWFGRIYIEQAT